MLSAAQNKFYWQLWSKLRKSNPGVDRHAEHEALGLPKSHTEWHPKHDFDRWKQHCLGEADSELPQDEEAKRKLVFIGHLLSALEEGQPYLEQVVASMNRGGKFGGRFRTSDTLSGPQLKGVMIALKKECRRRWREKDDLLGEIQALRVTHEYDERAGREAVERALNAQPGQLLPLVKMVYEDLLVVLSALRMQVPAFVSVREPESGEAVVVDADNCPF